MNSFKDKLLRLKNELKITTDKEVAAMLGLKPTAFAERKKTESFPERELFALNGKRPDLNLDMDYILLGRRREEFEAIEHEMVKEMTPAGNLFDPSRSIGELLDVENLLIQYFRVADKEGRETILNVAKAMANLRLTGQ